ncbi:MAG: sulfur carrier protein ThiS [Pseudomonadota bacterium]
MELIINGESARYDGLRTVSDLVAALGLEPKKLAVELNRAIVPKSAYGATPLSNGDTLEIVHFVGGG